MPSLLQSALLLVLLALTGRADIAVAQEEDPHRLYGQSCGSCHSSHAGDFVHEGIDYRNGTLVGRASGREVRSFLEAGHGKLSADEIEIIVDHLTRIRLSGVDVAMLLDEGSHLRNGRSSSACAK